MHETDWDSLFKEPVELERDAVVAFLYHEAELLRGSMPIGCYYLRRAAEAIVQGKHVGA